jgi:hypothetical protein
MTPEQIEDFLTRLADAPDARPIELAGTWLKEKGITDSRPMEVVAQLQQNVQFVSLMMPRMLGRMVNNLMVTSGLTLPMVDIAIASVEDALVKLHAKKSEMLIAGL